jgi:hypothetical protein
MDPKKLRKRLYVDRHVQGGIVARLMFLWLASTALAVGVWFLMQFFANPTEGFAYYLANAWRQVFPLVLAFAVTLPIAVLHLLRFTHRFAGPVVRLRRMMHQLASGQQVSNLKFRDHDYWQDLADDFNQIATALTAARRRVAELEQQLADVGQPVANDSRLEINEPVATA